MIRTLSRKKNSMTTPPPPPRVPLNHMSALVYNLTGREEDDVWGSSGAGRGYLRTRTCGYISVAVTCMWILRQSVEMYWTFVRCYYSNMHDSSERKQIYTTQDCSLLIWEIVWDFVWITPLCSRITFYKSAMHHKYGRRYVVFPDLSLDVCQQNIKIHPLYLTHASPHLSATIWPTSETPNKVKFTGPPFL